MQASVDFQAENIIQTLTLFYSFIFMTISIVISFFIVLLRR